MLANCTSSQSNSSDSQSGGDSTSVDSTAAGSTSTTQDPIKADTPITNGQRSMPKDTGNHSN
jgi:hypothetical protein